MSESLNSLEFPFTKTKAIFKNYGTKFIKLIKSKVSKASLLN
jgi:hypothetical protein